MAHPLYVHYIHRVSVPMQSSDGHNATMHGNALFFPPTDAIQMQITNSAASRRLQELKCIVIIDCFSLVLFELHLECRKFKIKFS
jgi:hypothetical protein